jgi:SAM-dependent methyltransferase
MLMRDDDDNACLACGGSKSYATGQQARYSWRRCDGCGSLFVPLASLAEQPNVYDSHYHTVGVAPPPGAFRRALEQLVSRAAPLRSSGRWLDIGFGAGALLEVVRTHGWAPYGTELSRSARDAASRWGWIVTDDPAKDARFVPGGFDVVSMIEVLEHSTRPCYLLDEAARYLRTGGMLHVTTPNVAALNRRILGLRWSIFSAPEHVVIWSPRGLSHQVRRRGFVDLRVRTHGLNPSELFPRRPDRAGQCPTRNEAGAALNEAMSANSLRRSAKTAANAALSLLRLGDTLKITAIRSATPLEPIDMQLTPPGADPSHPPSGSRTVNDRSVPNA